MKKFFLFLFVVSGLSSYAQGFKRTAHDTCFVGNGGASYTLPSFKDTNKFNITIFEDGFNLYCERGNFWTYDTSVGVFVFASPIEATEKVCITVSIFN